MDVSHWMLTAQRPSQRIDTPTHIMTTVPPMATHPAELLAPYLADVEEALHGALKEFTEPAWLYEPVRYLFEGGGKRIRPILTLLACESVGGDRASALPAAVAVELLHNFTLVHDDIMDSSDKRRGRDTVHVRWNQSAAILAGDVMMGMAMRLLMRSAHHAPKPLDVIDAFSTGLIEVCDGQALDLAFMDRDDVTPEEYFTMIEKKTARLLEMSVAIGANVGGATNGRVEALRSFAREIGIAFQMQDDILDITGSEAFGKSPGGDIVEGKRTWLMLECARRVREDKEADPDHSQLIALFFANNGIARERVADVLSMMGTYRVVTDATALVEKFTLDAFEHLHIVPKSPARDLLEVLARMLMARSV
ncbi:MAG: polyprenyl synthetase family protein [Candidatus Kapabacteria bacterium]|nr:polyprenyl synthetase family protein [Candidatus Kapabacteria bacterium]